MQAEVDAEETSHGANDYPYDLVDPQSMCDDNSETDGDKLHVTHHTKDSQSSSKGDRGSPRRGSRVARATRACCFAAAHCARFLIHYFSTVRKRLLFMAVVLFRSRAGIHRLFIYVLGYVVLDGLFLPQAAETAKKPQWS